MRAAAKGTYYENAIVCGLPCSSWVNLVQESYALGSMSYQFNGWPNGKSLMEQEQCVVEIFKIVLSELIKEINSGT